MIERHLWTDELGRCADPWVCAAIDEVKRIYDEKYRIANLLKPESVLEVGTRAGYTAAMFLEAGAKSYVGLDATDSWGGTPGAVDWSRKHLPQAFPQASIRIVELNTQKVNTLVHYGPVELVHVDGEHSFDGCLHDLELSLTCNPKWILVDDLSHHPESVLLAAETFLGRHRFKHVMLDTLRGDCLIQL